MRRLTLLIIMLFTIVAQVQAATYTAIQLRRDTAANWVLYNPVLAAGETGCEMSGTPLRCTAQKVGDGATAWATLPYTWQASTMAKAESALQPHTDIVVTGPAVDVREFASLTVAVGSPTTAGKTILISTAQTCNDLTIPLDRAIEVIKGGSINVATGKTLTINGPFNAGLYQIFTGAGSVKFNSGSAPTAPAEWWGAIADFNVGTQTGTDSTAAIQAALAAHPHVLLSQGNYKVSSECVVGDPALDYTLDTLTEANSRTLELDPRTTVSNTSTTTAAFLVRSYAKLRGGTVFLPANATTAAGVRVLSTPHTRDWSIEDFSVVGRNYTSAAGKGYGIHYDLTNAAAGYVVNGNVTNCRFYYLEKGEYVNLTGANASTWANAINRSGIGYTWCVTAEDVARGDGNNFVNLQVQWGVFCAKHFSIGGLNNNFTNITYWDAPSNYLVWELLSTSQNNRINTLIDYPTQVNNLGAENHILIPEKPVSLNSVVGNYDNAASGKPGMTHFFGGQDDILAYANSKYTVTSSGSISYGNLANVFNPNQTEVVYNDVTASNLVVTVNLGATAINITTVGINFYGTQIGTAYTIQGSNDGISWTTLVTEINNRSARPFYKLANYGYSTKYVRLTVTDGLDAAKKVGLTRIYATSNEKPGNLWLPRGGGSLYGQIDYFGYPFSNKYSVPATATDFGKPGYWAADASYFYVYTGDGTTHTWRRTATVTW